MLTDPAIYGRFMDKVVFEPSCGCWIWAGSGCPDYGAIKIDGRMHRAHRLTFEHFKGPIPKGMEPDHICRLKCCVNPDHLEAVTRRENLMRSIPFRSRKFKPRRVPECPGLAAALSAIGSAAALSRALGISQAALSYWTKVPLSRVDDVSKATGVPKRILRPDQHA